MAEDCKGIDKDWLENIKRILAAALDIDYDLLNKDIVNGDTSNDKKRFELKGLDVEEAQYIIVKENNIMLDREINLCDDCGNVNSFPHCTPKKVYKDLIFGEGVGLDNIIYCKNYDNMDRLLHHPNCTPDKCHEDCRLAAKAEQNLPELNEE